MSKNTEKSFPFEAYTTNLRDVYIELPEYEFKHGPHSTETNNTAGKPFVGRASILEKLKMLLKADTSGGAYLVTGFRGVGKTSYVNKAVGDLKKEGEKIVPIHISLAQEKLRSIDVLKVIAKKLYVKEMEIDVNNNQKKEGEKFVFGLFLFLLSFSIVFLVFFQIFKGSSVFNKNVFSGKSELYIIDMVKSIFSFLSYIIISLYLFCFIQKKILVSTEIFLENLKKLVDRLHSSIENENIQESSIKEILKNTFRQKKISPIADFREIEDELITILEQIKSDSDRRYIFIFDELDKIDFNASMESKDSTSTDKLSISGKTRRRQNTIADVLHNLKQFLNTANAKFIFIAGREMYDADLADIADRDFFWGSIFHDVIYVESLLKETSEEPFESRGSAISQKVEELLCNFLFPKTCEDKPKTLKEYYNILDSNVINLNSKNKELIKQKIFLLLEDFVIYLTYRSGGFPMKVIKILEDYIVIKDKDKLDNLYEDKYNNLCFHNLTEKPQKYLLKFSYFQQSEIGFIASIFRPYLYQNRLFLQSLGDKTLVSIPFIMDHILKYHDFGFSWRALEILPELLDVNRSPMLRKFVSNMLQYLSNKHIRSVDNGLYTFKFYKTTSNEISFLSKVSELSSAAFNFTLDESLPVKQHYEKRLRDMREELKNTKNTQDYLQTIYLTNIIGDLYFYDKEYDEALINYANAMQQLDFQNPKQEDRYQFTLLLRVMLKYALTLERMNTYDSALSVYATISKNIVSYYSKKDKTPAQDKMYNKITEIIQQDTVNSNTSGLETEETKWKKGLEQESNIFDETLKESHFSLLLPFIAQLFIIEKKVEGGISWIDLQRNEKLVLGILANTYDKREKFIVMSDYYHKISRLLFYKNGLIHEGNQDDNSFLEKIYTGFGFEFEKDSENKSKKDFNAPIGAWLYNCKALLIVKERFFNIKNVNEPKYININFKELQYKAIMENSELTAKLEKTLLFVFRSAISLDKIDVYEYKTLANNEELLNQIGNYLSDLGDILMNLSTKKSLIKDEFLSKIIGVDDNSNEFSNQIHNMEYYEKLLDTATSRVERAILFYRLAARYFVRTGVNKKVWFTYTKIIYTLKNYYQYSQKNNNLIKDTGENENNIFEKIVDSIFKGAIEAAIRINDNTMRSVIKYDKDVMNIEKGSKFKDIFSRYNIIFQLPEAKETILAMYELQLLTRKIYFNLVENPVTGYNRVNSNWMRVFELKYKLGLLNHIYEVVSFENNIRLWGEFKNKEKLDGLEVKNKERLRKYFDNVFTNENFISYFDLNTNLTLSDENLKTLHGYIENKTNITNDMCLTDKTGICKILYKLNNENCTNDFFTKICGTKFIKDKPVGTAHGIVFDAIFCCIYILKNLKLFDLSYVANHFYTAEVHFALAEWTTEYENLLLLSEPENKEIIQNALIKVIGKNNLYMKARNYNYELAYQHYYLCLQMHNQGRAYQRTIKDMYFLEDDFTDQISHFCASMDRYRINLGLIRERISVCKEYIKTSELYDDDSYFKTSI